jgi:hypothetical protein
MKSAVLQRRREASVGGQAAIAAVGFPRLVDTVMTPILLKVVSSGKLLPGKLLPRKLVTITSRWTAS